MFSVRAARIASAVYSRRNGIEFGSTHDPSIYVIQVVGDVGFPGQTMAFRVGTWADQTIEWQQGVATQLNLTATSRDHFKGYDTNGDSLRSWVLLQDLFNRLHRPDERSVFFKTLLFRPERFCTPVEKTTADGTSTPIQYPGDHLTFYKDEGN